MKTRSFVLKFNPQKAENRILGLWSVKISHSRTRLDPVFPPKRRGLTAPCWYSRLLDSNLLATSIFIETPVHCNVTGIQTQATLVGRECSHHCTTLAPYVTQNCIFVKVINNVQNPWHEISDQNRKKHWFSLHLTSAIFNNNNNNFILVSMYCI